MSKARKSNTAPGESSVEVRLARLLEAPFLAQVIPHLPPETLHQLIRHSGLDACGELVTAATPAQLTSLLDLDLWRAQSNRDERFNVERFGEWLEVLVDAGDAVAVRTVASLDKEIVIAGLTRYVRVFDPGIFEPTAQSDDESIQRFDAMREGDSIHADGDGIGDRLECEVAGYIVRARRTDAWDAIIALMIALEAGHPDYFHAVMQGCRLLSNSRPEEDGFYDLLLAPEQHLHEVTLEREHRRSLQGYATAGDARAFLKMARTRSNAPIKAGSNSNPIATAYFRATERRPDVDTQPNHAHTHEAELPASFGEVVELLTEAGVMPGQPRALLNAAPADPHAGRLASLRRALAHVQDTNESTYLTRTRELAFLANTLLAGCSVQSRAFTPSEASDAAAGVCNLAIECWPQIQTNSLLIDHDLVTVFEMGWSVLYTEVSLFSARQLIEVLRGLHSVDRDMRLELIALRRSLEHQCEAGTPWRARDAVDVLAMLDTTASISLRGLLDECPVLPSALSAILEGRTTTVSATAFEFISTADQIGEVRRFMQQLPMLLAN